MYNNSKITKAVRLAMMFGAGTAVAVAAPAFAEEEDGAKVERIEVTGSRIKRTDMEGASPVAVFSKIDIENTGISTVAEFLRNSASTGGFNESSTLSQSAGASSVGLKGFGSDYTLILLNGRRLPKNSAGGVYTDVNQIPMAAVERIEILPDGASAIYGSDAVAGVINVITKTSHEGIDIKAKYGNAIDNGDGDEVQFQIVAGASTDKTNILFAADYFERRPIMAKDREMGSTAYIDGHPGGEGRSTWGIPGSTYVSSPSTPDTGWAPWSDCPTENIHPNGRCRYDFAPLYTLQPQSDRFSILTTINHEATEDLSFDGQFRYTRAYTKTSNAPAPGAVDITNSPYLRDFLINDRYKDDPTLGAQIADEIAGGSGFAYVGRRYLDFPNRQKDNTNDTFEIVLGVDYLMGDNWEVNFDWGHSTLTNRQVGAGGQLLVANVEAAFADGTLNPFVINDCSSAELADFCKGLNSSIHRTSEYEVTFATGGISGMTGLELPGGEVGVAVGLDWRRENYLDRSDTASIEGAVIGGAGSDGGGKFRNDAYFVEVSLPVLDELEVNLAARNDSADWGVSDASETTYSAKLAYRPTDDLIIRASYGTGFKAPSLDSLYLAGSFGVSKATDTKLCNAAGNDQSHPDCQSLELNSKSGGNLNLQPETSVSYNVGAAYQITDDLSFSLDYWSLEIEDIVGSLGIQEILDEEARGNLTDLVIRNSAGRLDDTGRTGFVKTDLQNLNEASATGLIYDIKYTTELSFGSLSASFRAEQYLTFETQNSAVQPLCDVMDNESDREWNSNGNITLDSGDFNTSLNMRYLGGYEDYEKRDTAASSCNLVGHYNTVQDADGNYTDFGDAQSVDSYVEFDIKTTYTYDSNNTFTLGMRNIFDEQPPFSSVDDWPFYDQGTYSNIGRFVYVEYNLSL